MPLRLYQLQPMFRSLDHLRIPLLSPSKQMSLQHVVRACEAKESHLLSTAEQNVSAHHCLLALAGNANPTVLPPTYLPSSGCFCHPSSRQMNPQHVVRACRARKSKEGTCSSWQNVTPSHHYLLALAGNTTPTVSAALIVHSLDHLHIPLSPQPTPNKSAGCRLYVRAKSKRRAPTNNHGWLQHHLSTLPFSSTW